MGQAQTNYQAIEVDDYLSEKLEELESERVWDCVMVFNDGSDEDFRPPANPHALEHDYLDLLDQDVKELRRSKFALISADMGGTTKKISEFYDAERKLVLDVLSIKSILHTEVRSRKLRAQKKRFYFIGIMEITARKTAADFNYDLKLDPDYAATYLHLANNELAKATFEDDEHINLELWRNIFVRYVEGIPANVYQQHMVLSPNDKKRFARSLFRIKDRCALIVEIVCGDLETGGCGIVVDRLRVNGHHPMDDFFPLHQKEQLDLIIDELFNSDSNTWLELPCDDIRIYFGEYIAIYFAFLEFFTIFLLPISIIGTAFFVLQIVYGRVLCPGIEYFAFCVVIAAVAFPSMWRSKEYEWATRWGQLRFDFQERARPQFHGDYLRSSVDGRVMEYYSPAERNTKRCMSFSIVSCFLLALLIATVGIIALRLWAKNVATSMSDYVVSVANAFVIIFFNFIYGGVAETMNEWENYETETAYENNLIFKVFVFRFVNSYASLYYMAFFRKYESFDDSLSCDAEECMRDLTSQLAVIFLTQLIFSNAMELGSLYVARGLNKGLAYGVDDDDEKGEEEALVGSVRDPEVGERVFHEYNSEQYERTFDDYNELLITWGYCTLFVLAFPLAPLFGFVSLLVESRIDGYKVCRLVRRPFPRRADDIGAWQGAVEFMSWVIIGTNIFLVCFMSHAFRVRIGNYKNNGLIQIITATLVFVALSIIWQCVDVKYKRMPEDIVDHIERTNHVEKSLMRRSQETSDWMNDLAPTEVIEWKKWDVDTVLVYLNRVLLRNEDTQAQVQDIFKHYNIDGAKFEKLTSEQLRTYGLRDNWESDLIISVRGILKKFAADAKRQREMIDALAAERDAAAEAVSGGKPTFRFTLRHLSPLARCFESKIKGQAKKRLWERVDEDGSDMIEENEMHLFLYYCISVFVRQEHADAKPPNIKDERLNKVILPLKHWLLHFKISSHGLSYEEFDRFFPSWLREYEREQQSKGYKHGEIKETEVELSEVVIESSAAAKGSGDDNPWTPFLPELVKFVSNLAEKPRKSIWNKVAGRNPTADTERQLPRLLQILFQLFHSKRKIKAFPFSRSELAPFLKRLSEVIRGYLRESDVITYEEFVKNIHRYLQGGLKKLKKPDF